MGIGKRLKAILKSQNKTILWLSEETGISKNTLYTITKRDSEKIKGEFLEKISSALCVPAEVLLYDNINDLTENISKKVFEAIRVGNKKEIIKLLNSKGYENYHSILKNALDNLNEMSNDDLSTFYLMNIMKSYEELNIIGKEEASIRVKELTEIQKYKA